MILHINTIFSFLLKSKAYMIHARMQNTRKNLVQKEVGHIFLL